MPLVGPAKRLTVYLEELDRFGHHALSHELLTRAHDAGLAGATVFRGTEGFGASNHLHTTRILSLSDDLPVCVVIVDAATAIESFLEDNAELLAGGLVTLEDVEVRVPVPRGPDGG